MSRIASLGLACLFTLPIFAQDATSPGSTLIQQAQAAYQAKHFTESAALYTRAIPLLQESDRAATEYHLACTQALAGDTASAFLTLNQAVEDGYTDRKRTEADKDLASLYPDLRWPQLVARMSLVTAEQDARWGDAAFATPNAVNLPDADKMAGLAELWAQAKYGFANFWHDKQERQLQRQPQLQRQQQPQRQPPQRQRV